jgi:hypothetical protein
LQHKIEVCCTITLKKNKENYGKVHGTFESTTDLFNQAILVADLERHLNLIIARSNKAKDLFM